MAPRQRRLPLPRVSVTATTPGIKANVTGPIASTNRGTGGTSNLASVNVYVTLDIDASGAASSYDPMTEGLLIIRYPFGLRGPALINGAVGTGATRDGPGIEAYLQSLMP